MSISHCLLFLNRSPLHFSDGSSLQLYCPIISNHKTNPEWATEKAATVLPSAASLPACRAPMHTITALRQRWGGCRGVGAMPALLFAPACRFPAFFYIAPIKQSSRSKGFEAVLRRRWEGKIHQGGWRGCISTSARDLVWNPGKGMQKGDGGQALCSRRGQHCSSGSRC